MLNPPELTTRAKIAERAAYAAGHILRDYVHTKLKVSYKRNDDPVTRADSESEKAIKKLVLEHFPNDTFIGEESGVTLKSSEFVWVIDPLDGTKSFLENKSGFSVSICVLKSGVPLIGIVYDVMNDRIYTAIRGEGFFVDGKKKNTIKGTGKLLALKNNAEPYRSAIEKIVPQLEVPWEFFTSTALALALVAEGKALGVLKLSYMPWDIAAGCLLVGESGGFVTDCFGENLEFLSPAERNNKGVFAGSRLKYAELLPKIKHLRVVSKLL